jgi:agmatinase
MNGASLRLLAAIVVVWVPLVQLAVEPAAAAAAEPGSKNAESAVLESKLQGLSPDKRAFISDPRQLSRFNLTPEKLLLALGSRDDADIDRFVTALMAVVEESKFHEGQDAGEIALNPGARKFNAPTTLRPALLDPRQRDPGPFSLDRYVNQRGGIPTFAHAPIAIRKEDLAAGKVEVAFVGVPLDFSSGYRDGKNAPMFLRAMDGLTGTDPDALVDPNLELRLADYGDIAVDYMSAERSMDHVRMMVRDMASVGTVPFIVGGDHSLMYPDVRAVVDIYGQGKVGVVLLDAHSDNAVNSDHLISDQQAVRRLVDDGVVAGRDIVQVGLRGPESDRADRKRLHQEGIKYHTMGDVEVQGWNTVMDHVLQEARLGPKNVFVSFDISVLDPVYATGAGRPVPGGLSIGQALQFMRKLCSETKIVGFEMLDVAPVMDASYKTALNANAVMHACLSGIAVRKMGH